MKKLIALPILVMSLLVFSVVVSYASIWVNNVTITQISTYSGGGTHFFWTSGGPGSECATASNPVLFFDETVGGGKSLFALLLSAFLSGKPVNIWTSGCNVLEVYIHN